MGMILYVETKLHSFLNLFHHSYTHDLYLLLEAFSNLLLRVYETSWEGGEWRI